MYRNPELLSIQHYNNLYQGGRPCTLLEILQVFLKWFKKPLGTAAGHEQKYGTFCNFGLIDGIFSDADSELEVLHPCPPESTDSTDSTDPLIPGNVSL